MAIDSGILDEAMSRVSNGVAFVKLLNLQGHSNHDIEKGIQHYIEMPTLLGDWETIITNTALKYLHQQQQNN